MLVSGCALLTPASRVVRWIRDQGHLKNWRGSVLQLGCPGCLCKGGSYGTAVLWFAEVVNHCTGAKHKEDGISRGFLLLHRVKQDSVLFMLHPLGIACVILQTEPCNKTDGSVRRCQEKLCCFSPLPLYEVVFVYCHCYVRWWLRGEEVPAEARRQCAPMGLLKVVEAGIPLWFWSKNCFPHM